MLMKLLQLVKNKSSMIEKTAKCAKLALLLSFLCGTIMLSSCIMLLRSPQHKKQKTVIERHDRERQNEYGRHR